MVADMWKGKLDDEGRLLHGKRAAVNRDWPVGRGRRLMEWERLQVWAGNRERER